MAVIPVSWEGGRSRSINRQIAAAPPWVGLRAATASGGAGGELAGWGAFQAARLPPSLGSFSLKILPPPSFFLSLSFLLKPKESRG